MSRLEDAVAHDLANAVDPPPIDRVQRRARRQRARWVASSVVPVLAVVAALAIVVTTNTHRNVDVSTVTSRSTTAPTTSTSTAAPTTTLPPTIAALPVANVEAFPRLDEIMQRARGYDEADGRVDYGEIVATTRDKTYALFGGRNPVDTRPIYLVRLVGAFTCNACSVPPGVKAPHGDEILFTFTVAQSQPLNDVFEVGSRAVDLSSFGPVYRLPLEVSARVELPSQTMRAGSTMSGRVIIENDTGAPLRVAGCGDLFQLALSNHSVKPDVAWRACLQFFTIPVGASSYRVTIRASYNSCSMIAQRGVTSCLANGQVPPLPAGEYHAVLFQTGAIAPAPPPLMMRVTP